MENTIDKRFLLTYTCTGYDGFRHFCHSWFETEDALREFVQKEMENSKDLEPDLSIELLTYRQIEL